MVRALADVVVLQQNGEIGLHVQAAHRSSAQRHHVVYYGVEPRFAMNARQRINVVHQCKIEPRHAVAALS